MKRINQAIHGILSALLALLGFGSCGIVEDEYGSPYAEYQVKGQVTDEEGNPIEGIRVTFETSPDTLYTDANGHFESKEIRNVAVYGKIKFEDIDGSAHGSFLPDSADLANLEQKQIEKGDGNWYEGKFEINVQQQLKSSPEGK